MILSIDTKNKTIRAGLWIGLMVYTLVLTKLILFKRPSGYIKDHLLHRLSLHSAKANLHKAYLQPFESIKFYFSGRMPFSYVFVNLIGNIAGFIPMAIFLAMLFKPLRSAPACILCIFFISVGFELFQLVTALGVCDIDDVILNTFGGMIGYFIFWLMNRFFVIK